MCEVNETVSCQQVLTSQYGSVLGIPVAAGGAIWSLLVFMLAAFGLKDPKSETASRVAGYIFVLSTLGLARVFYFGYVSFFVLKTACLLCMTMYVSVIGTFLISAECGRADRRAAVATRSGYRGPLPESHRRDACGRVARGVSAVWFSDSRKRRRRVRRRRRLARPHPAAPVETLTPEQRTEWEAWLDAQPRKPEAMPTGATKVLVLKFNDYQCPSCRLAWILYKDIIAKYEKANPGVFVFENRDYPLETECGAGNAGHAAACEAAAAVRMAREKNRDKELEAALFERQSPSMTRDEVVAALQQVAQISSADFDSKYAKTLESVRADVQLGQKLGVHGYADVLPERHPAAEPAAGLLRCRASTGRFGGSARPPEGACGPSETIRQEMMGWMPSRPKVSRSTTR